MQQTAAQAFEKNRYIYLTQALPKDACQNLTDHMFKLSKEGKLTKDDQCPLSESVYGDPLLDQVLEKLTKPLSGQLGIELLPAYTYARIYAPGEELVKHKDRPSCEISGTMTLGFDPGSGIWPIYLAKMMTMLLVQDLKLVSVISLCTEETSSIIGDLRTKVSGKYKFSFIG